MELTKLELTNWLCHHHKVIDFAPLTIIAGPNSSGKSPIADGIAFALNGELRRVSAAGERAQLLTEGSKMGSVTLRSGGWATTRDIETAKPAYHGTPPTTAKTVREALPYVLDVERFARATNDQRSLVLRKVMAVDLDGDSLKAEMISRGHDAGLLKVLERDASVDQWVQVAQRSATEARGAWKAVTGETYGSVKAKTWTAPAVTDVVEAVEMTRLTTQVTVLDVEQGDLQRRLGEIEAEQRRGTNHAHQVQKLRADAAKLDIASEHLAEVKAQAVAAVTALAEAEQRVKGLARPALPAGPQGHRMCCPSCGKPLVVKDGMLVDAPKYVPAGTLIDPGPPQPADSEVTGAAKALSEARLHLASISAAEAAAQAVLDTANAARQALDFMMPGDVPDAGPALGTKADLEGQIRDVQSRLGAARTAERNAQEANAAARRSTQRTTEAAGHHRTVEEWLKIAEALAPDGIPGELLGKALAPFNATLRDFAATVGWKQVTVTTSLEITAHGRRYELLGESERWRTDVMIAVALAIHSDFRFVLIDRFDVLEPAARGRAMAWLLALTKAKMMDTVTVMATLKAAPSAPPGAVVHWLGAPQAQQVAA